MQKNESFTAEIVDMSTEGLGIGKVAGYTLFIKDAVIGDTVKGVVTKAKKNYGYGRITEIITPSPDRVEPRCPVAKQCGGCQLQALSYEKQLEFKVNKVVNNLAKIGGVKDYELELPIGMDEPFYYRNKAQYPVGLNRDNSIITGFYAGRTHSIIENDVCHINNKENAEIIGIVKAWMNEYDVMPYNEESGTGLVRHILTRVGYKTGQIMVCLIINGGKIPGQDELVNLLCNMEGMTSISLNVNKEKTNVILGKQIINLYGEGYIEDFIGDIKFQISPLSFYQVNPAQTKKLYDRALEYADLSGNETVWDMYCGIGTISLFLAKKAKQVYGVEIVKEAIDDAKNNAKINNISNAEFFVGKAEDVVPAVFEERKETSHPDVVVVDPPRKGCDQNLLNTIVRMAPKRMVYVSCDSATLARDIKYMEENGYKVLKVTVVDQFAQTVHVETVVLMSNKLL